NKYAVALSVWAALIYRVTGDDDIVLYIANNKILRFNIQPTWSFNELYSTINNELNKLNSIEANFSFDELAESIQSCQDQVKRAYARSGKEASVVPFGLSGYPRFQIDELKHHFVDFASNLDTSNNA
ncbi:hypothetical protein OO258_27425, partial [Pseudomonas sp. DCB_BI]|nr:hypothetical protein [Pseudomonas sp. DCB_BI]